MPEMKTVHQKIEEVTGWTVPEDNPVEATIAVLLCKIIELLDKTEKRAQAVEEHQRRRAMDRMAKQIERPTPTHLKGSL